MAEYPSAKELESEAAASPPAEAGIEAPTNQALAMLLRRGFRPQLSPHDLPFAPEWDGPLADALNERLRHYAFRLFLRGAIMLQRPFEPAEVTRYLSAAQAQEHAEELVRMALAEPAENGTYRLLQIARSFGGTLEWYIARELRRRLGFEVALRVKFDASGVGGDLDIVAAADGRLVYIEAKSGPPKHLSEPEVSAFFDRLEALRPDVALFVLDTSLRLGDKVVPMLHAEVLKRRAQAAAPRQVQRELWALGRHLYLVNAKPDLINNVIQAIGEGLRALAPDPF